VPRLPRISGGDLVRALKRGGWRQVRQRGSHIVLHHATRTGRLVVPVHRAAILKPKTLQSIIDAAGISPDELRRLL
jgi:predicted RNA binding protein YcfA (HicA-like mRNA interferase family)